MKVFVIGATGFIGGAVARAFLGSGAEVTGMARSEEKAASLRAVGIRPVVGDLEHLTNLADEIRGHHVVVFAPVVPYEDEPAMLEFLISLLENTGRALIYTSGTGVLSIPTPNGEWRQESFSEDDAYEPRHWLMMRVNNENIVRNAVERGVRGLVVRPPIVWGNNGGAQVPNLFETGKELGYVPYVGAGLNLYSTVHVDDAAQVYALAARYAPGGALYHAVSGEAAWRTIAEAIAQVLGVEARSIPMSAAVELWGERRAELWFGVSSRSRAVRAHRDFGWKPTRLDLIGDIREGSYASRADRDRD